MRGAIVQVAVDRSSDVTRQSRVGVTDCIRLLELGLSVFLDAVCSRTVTTSRPWPDLAKEIEKLCLELGLPNITKQNIPLNQWKMMVKAKIRENIEEMQDELKKYAKVN